MAEKWIQKAIKNPGALTRQAKQAGAVTKQGTISNEWLQEKAAGGGVTARRARLALTLRKLRKRRTAPESARREAIRRRLNKNI